MSKRSNKFNSPRGKTKRKTSVKSKSYARETVERRIGQYVRSAVFYFLLSYIYEITASQEEVFDPVKIFKNVFVEYSKMLGNNAIGSIVNNLLYVLFFGYIFKSRVEKFIHEKIYQRILKVLNSTAIIIALIDTAYLMYKSRYNNEEYTDFQKYTKNCLDYSVHKRMGGKMTWEEFMEKSDEYKTEELHSETEVEKLNFLNTKADFINKNIMAKEDFTDYKNFKIKYRELMRVYHPDKCKTEKCKKIAVDLNFLMGVMDKQKRRRGV